VFDHVTIRVSDREAARTGDGSVARSHSGEDSTCPDFGIAQADDDHAPTRTLHVAFVARSRLEVDAFWQAATDAGCRSDGDPGRLHAVLTACDHTPDHTAAAKQRRRPAGHKAKRE